MEIDKLVVCPSFHGYHSEIQAQLAADGPSNLVFHYDEKKFRSKLNSIILFLFRNIFRPVSNTRFFNVGINYILLRGYPDLGFLLEEYLSNRNLTSINKILMIKAFGFSAQTIVNIKNRYNVNELSIYQWDSVEKYPSVYPLYPLCNKVYCFQNSDAQKFGFEYLPNFVVQQFNQSKAEAKSVDICYVGQFSFERYRLISKYFDVNKHYSFDVRLITNSKIIQFFLNKAFVSAEPLSRQQVAEIYTRSRAVFEIPIRDQVGMSQRVLEAISYDCNVVALKEIEMGYISDSVFAPFVHNKSTNIDNLDNPSDSPLLSAELNKYMIKNWLKVLM